MTPMGRKADLDLLHEDRRTLPVLRVHVLRRLEVLRGLLDRAGRESVTTWEQRETRARIDELETIAGLLGIE